jgi:hypothetical protein
MYGMYGIIFVDEPDFWLLFFYNSEPKFKIPFGSYGGETRPAFLHLNMSDF